MGNNNSNNSKSIYLNKGRQIHDDNVGNNGQQHSYPSESLPLPQVQQQYPPVHRKGITDTEDRVKFEDLHKYIQQSDRDMMPNGPPPVPPPPVPQQTLPFQYTTSSSSTSHDYYMEQPPPTPPLPPFQQYTTPSPSTSHDYYMEQPPPIPPPAYTEVDPIIVTPSGSKVSKSSYPSDSKDSKSSYPSDSKDSKSSYQLNSKTSKSYYSSDSKSYHPSESSSSSSTNTPIAQNTNSSSTSSPGGYTFSTTTKKSVEEDEDIYGYQRFECAICLEKRHVKKFLNITETCNHEKYICRNCIIVHVETILNDKGDTNITCPFTGCGQPLKHEDVKRLVKKGTYARFDLLSLRQNLNSMSDFRWCKNSGCGSGQIHANGELAPIMTCETCGEKSCYTHDIPWHENMSCAEYDDSKKTEEAATIDYLTRETKACPKCGVRISKNGGCNHMSCKVFSCKYEFCWLCLADFDEIRKHGNDRHKRGCQLYA